MSSDTDRSRIAKLESAIKALRLDIEGLWERADEGSTALQTIKQLTALQRALGHVPGVTPQVCQLAVYFAHSTKELVTTEELAVAVMREPSTRIARKTMSTLICYLRRGLTAAGHPNGIVNYFGKGYAMTDECAAWVLGQGR